MAEATTGGSVPTMPEGSEARAGAESALGDPGRASERGSRKVRQGTVVSDKMHKTIVVALQRTVEHPLYKKRMGRTTRIKAHDAENACRAGDRVAVMETRPLSKEKRWRLVSILERAK